MRTFRPSRPRHAEASTTPRRISRRWVVVLAVGTVTLGGSAFATWAISGAGSGTAATGTVVSVQVKQTSTVSGLAPGLPAQLLSGNFDNPNAGPVYVTAVSATVSGTNVSGCGASDYVIGGAANVLAEIPAGNGVGSWTGLTIQFVDKPGVDQNACKNAVVALTYASN